MKIEKQASLVITFHTTTEAMAFEAAAQTAGVPGRLIPVPREISVGCGLAWMSRLEASTALLDFLQTNDFDYAGQHELVI